MLRFHVTTLATFLLTGQSFAQRAPQYYTENPMPSGESVLTYSLIGLVLGGIFFLMPNEKNPFTWATPILIIGSFLCFLPLIIWVGTIIVVGGQVLIITGVLGAVVVGIIRLLTKGTSSYESKESVSKAGSVPNISIEDKQQKLREAKATEEKAKFGHVSSNNEVIQGTIAPKITRRPAPTREKVIIDNRRPLVGFDQADQPISLKQFIVANDFVKVNPTVKTNASGYPFITFITSTNKAENIYFSKDASLNVASGDPVTRELFAGLQVQQITNADGDVRVKLVQHSAPLF